MRSEIKIIHADMRRSSQTHLLTKAILRVSDVTVRGSKKQLLEVTYQGRRLNPHWLKTQSLRVVAPELGFEQVARRINSKMNRAGTIRQSSLLHQTPRRKMGCDRQCPL
jgi:hypothetical protein